MGTVTYPEPKVIEYFEANLIPLQVAFDDEPISKDFNIKWTPALITLGQDGREHHRTIGFLDPQGLLARLLLGIGKYHFDNDRFVETASVLGTIMKEYPQSDAVPEAIFISGVTGYKSSGNPGPLKEAYEKLSSNYPDNEWTKRAYPYRLL